MSRSFWLCVLTVAVCATCRAGTPIASEPGAGDPRVGVSVVLGCPTDSSVVLNVLAEDGVEGYVEYGDGSARRGGKTAPRLFPAGEPVEVSLTGLEPAQEYGYRFWTRHPGTEGYGVRLEGRFQTQRRAGETFTFEVQGDSHPERASQFDAALYAATLQAAAADRPDFYILMGDDFSVDTLRLVTADSVAGRYRLQRSFLGAIGRCAPLFLVNGNHEQAAMCNLNGTTSNVAVWAQTARNRYFSQPAPGRFYTGDATPVNGVGLLRDYYAWRWGDALFIVIDPYWHSPQPVDNVYGGGRKTRDRWASTLGESQYQWFKGALESNDATFIFVFAHHVLGTGRGGIENAMLGEWGGQNSKGVREFERMRPGWEDPIHTLMAKHHVTIFFQGHDHIFARQELDGVVYQTLPEPADPDYAFHNREAYRSGQTLPNSGRVRVTVAPAGVQVEYVRSRLARDATPEHPDGEVACRYSIPARRTGK